MRHTPIIVAELSINHLGMRKLAIVILQKCKEIGVDYVKFKIKNVKKYYKKSPTKYNGYDFITYRNSFELSEDDFEYINNWCKKNKLPWFATVHDSSGLDFLSRYEVPFYKIASSDSQNLSFVRKVVKHNESKKPLIISTGGCSLKHIDKIVKIVSASETKLYLLHCVSMYPTPIDKCNIKFITRLRKKYESDNIKIGYSGHETGWLPTLFAVHNGASIIERHITVTRNLNIHHIAAALTLEEFSNMVDDINNLSKMISAKDVEFYNEEYGFIRDKKYK